MNALQRKQSGFTLIEISIVLVIIGLLLGGILKGQELITNSKMKSIISDARAISAAIFTYQDLYKALPGDDANAQTNFGDASLINGNGSGDLSETGASAESILFFSHLRAADLLSGSGTTVPIHAFQGQMLPSDNAYSLPGLAMCFDDLPGDIARMIDLQEDDGNPSTGIWQGHATETVYVSGTEYRLCKDM